MRVDGNKAEIGFMIYGVGAPGESVSAKVAEVLRALAQLPDDGAPEWVEIGAFYREGSVDVHEATERALLVALVNRAVRLELARLTTRELAAAIPCTVDSAFVSAWADYLRTGR